MTERRRPSRISQALALEPRILLDAAVTETANAVVEATASKPGVTVDAAKATITIDDDSAAQSVDLFSNVSVSTDTSGESLTTLVITVDSSGSNQALIIDGSTISLENTGTGGSTTADNGYYYTVSVGGSTTTITIALNSVEDVSASDVASLIDGIQYSTLDKTVESGTVNVTLTSLSDDSDTTELSISSTITIDSDINAAPKLSDDSALEAAESIEVSDLGDDAQVVYSSDGSHAYVAGNGTLSVFAVDDSGRLTLESTLAVEGMGTATEMVSSSDGNSLYIIDGSETIYVFSVDSSGTVSLASTVSTSNGLATGGLTISDDGAYVYVGTQWNGVAAFSRDATTGELTFVTRLPQYSSDRNGVVVTSGDYVYIIYTTGSHSIYVYLNNGDGTWSEQASYITSVSGYSAVGYSLSVSEDGQYLYIADPVNGNITVYQFSDGTLSAVETTTLSNVTAIALSSDGSLLYATTSSGISVYSVSSSGTLTLLSTIADANAGDIAVSSDGLSLLVTTSSGVTRYTVAQTLDQGSYATFASGVTVADSNYDKLNDGAGNYNGASITVSTSVEGGTFGFADGNGLTYADGVISLDGSAIATLSVSDGVLTVKFTADVDTTTANLVLQQLTYANDSASAGSYITLIVSVSDGELSSSTLSLTLRVNAVPKLDTDVATGYALASATSETAYSYTLFSGLFNDADGDSLTWSVSGLPEGLSFDGEMLTISGSALEAGTFSVVVTVTDASGASASLTLELVVEQIANRAPVVNDEVSTTLDYATEGTDYSTKLDSTLFTDADHLYGDTLTWTVSGLPDGFTFDAETLTITGSSSEVGDYTFTVTVTDAAGATASVELTLRVITTDEADNSAPTLDAADSALVYTAEGGLDGYSYAVNDLELSPDDSTLIVVGNTSLGHAVTASGTAYITVYSRDTETGELTLIQTLVQGTTDDGNDSNGVEVDGLANATAVTYSEDGTQVYIAGTNSAGAYVITIFDVNADGTLSATGLSVVVGAQVKAITLSADGSALYVVSASSVYSYGIGDDGSLTLAGSYAAASSNTYGVAVDSRGYVYVSSGTYLMVFSANEDGTLTQLVSASGLSLSTFVRTLAVTDDGYIFLATGTSNTVVTVYFDSESNTLTKVASVSAGTQVWGLTLSADSTTLYVGTNTGNLLVYSINDDGSLSLVTTVTSIGARAYRITVSSDGSSIYAGGFFTSAGLGTISTSNTVSGNYTEGGTVQPLSVITLADADYDALNDSAGDYNGATITLVRDGGADSDDSYGFADDNGLTLVDGVIYLDDSAIATFVSENGTLTLTFTTTVSTATANLVLKQITYSNSSDDPDTGITLVLSVADEYTSSSIAITLSVTAVNDAPTLEASAGDVVYTSGGNAVKLFEDSAVSTIEDGQTISSLTLTVSGLSDGESETLVVGGTSVALTSGASASGSITVTDEDGSAASYTYILSVSVDDDGIATVTLSGSLTASVAQTLIDSIAYANTSDTPTEGDRTITLTSIQDSGGTSNGGADTTALAISASVSVSLTNTAPTLTSTGATASYTEGGSAATLFSGTSISAVEDGQSITSLTLTISGLVDGESETLTVDGTAIALVEGSGTTSSGYGYTVSVDASTSLVTVTLNSSDGIAASSVASLVDAIAYADSSDDPTEGTRTVTLTSVSDDGGTANSGTDTTILAISATVTVAAVNNAPTLEASAVESTYSTTGSSASLFSNVTVSTIESGQSIAAVTFTVSGVSDAGSETLTIDGTAIALAAGSGKTSSGYSYTVSIDGSTVTVTIVNPDGLSGKAAAALIESTSYGNHSSTKTSGERTISVSVQDDGGTDNGGQDTTTLAASAVIAVVENSAPVLSAEAQHNDLEIADSLTEISGLSGIAASALNNDGTYLYVVSSDGTVAIIQRNTSTGELVLQETVETDLSSVSSIVVSEDGNTVYVLGDDGDALAIYSRDASDGSLTLQQTLVTENLTDFAVSSDGSSIYAVDGNYSGLRVYTLDSDSGQYVLSQSIAASTGNEPYLFTGVSVTVVGDYVYVVTDPASDNVANTLIVYQIGEDGTLTAVAFIRDGAADRDATVSISSPVDIAVSSDGSLVYVASEDSIGIFSFDADSGTLSYVGIVSGLSNVTSVALSSDGGTLYITSLDGSIGRYQVADDGTLTLLETIASDTEAALSGAASVSIASGGAVVVTGSGGVVSLNDGLADEVALDYTEQGTIALASLLTLSDADYDALGDGAGNYNGAIITIARSGGADSSDTYGFTDGNGLSYANGVISLDGEAIATFVADGGTLTVTFTADVTTEVANLVLTQITFSNTSDYPASRVSLTLQVTDQYDASVSVTLALNVTAVNDAPTLTTTGAAVSYTEGGSAATLFSGTSVSTVEDGQSITSLTLTVSGVVDGESETLTVDGTAIALVEGSGTTSSGYGYTVSVDASTSLVTVTLNSSDGIAASSVASLVDAIAYADSSDDPTEGTRTVTLTSVSDDGGTANSGTDTTALSISASVTVTAVNDAPTLTSTGATASYTEGGSAATLFSGTSVSTVEDGQSITSLTLTVSGVVDGESETLTVDGTAIALVEGSGTTSSGYGYTVSVDASTGLVTVTLSSSDGIAASSVTSLVDAIAYTDSSDDPTEGTRTVTLISVSDDGGTANSGTDTTALAISATVIVTAVNDAPILTASGTNTDYAASGDAVTLFSAAVISTVEDGQSITSLTLTVSGVSDGTEQLVIDGTVITLTAGSGTTASGYTYTVSVNDGNLTVTLTFGSEGIATATAASLVDTMAYQNASDTVSTGERSVTLTTLTDDGGTENDGSDTSNVSISAVVTVVNSAPQTAKTDASLANATQGETYSATLATDLFEDADGDSLIWTVSGLPEGLSFDAETFTISGTTTATAGDYAVTLTVTDPSGETASLVLTLTVDEAIAYIDPVVQGFDLLHDLSRSQDLSGETANAAARHGQALKSTQDFLAAASAGVTRNAGELLDALLSPAWNEGQIEATQVTFSDGSSSPLVVLAAADGPAIVAQQPSVTGQWTYDPAANRLVFKLPEGLFASRMPVASLELRSVDGRPLPAGVRLDAGSGSIVLAGTRAIALDLRVVLRTVDGQSLNVPVHIEPAAKATGRSTQISDLDRQGHEDLLAKPALSDQLRQGPANDLLGQARALLAQLTDAPQTGNESQPQASAKTPTQAA